MIYFREMCKNKWWFNSLILYLFTNFYLLCMFSGTNTIPKKETLHLYVFHIVIFYIMCMFIGTKPFFENTNITKNKRTTIPMPIVLTGDFPITDPLHCWLPCDGWLSFTSHALLLNEFPDYLPMKLARQI